jgi:adenine-specific DNA-methyltransferase
MIQAVNLQPLNNELPSHFADRLGVLYAKTVTTQHKKDNGQSFTQTEIAHFMARLVNFGLLKKN